MKERLAVNNNVNTTLDIFMGTFPMPRRKGRLKENPVRRLNFIEVTFILLRFCQIFTGISVRNPEYITGTHFKFLLAE